MNPGLLLPFALVATLAANAPAAAQTGVVEGQTVGWPARPGPTRPGAPSTRPMPATLAILGARGNVVATVQSDDSGAFRASLPPGRYSLRLDGANRVARLRSPADFTIVAGKTVQVQAVIDTGMR